jgi:hypothetical protein
MASPRNVDLVVVVDISASMRPCIDGLRTHLREILKPMQGHVAKVRFGLVGLSASRVQDGVLYRMETLAGGGETVAGLYESSKQYTFFTEDPSEMTKRLDSLQTSGDEDHLVALDIAMDHPFGPLTTHKRVIALFSDEKIETGIYRNRTTPSMKSIVEKLHARRIKLFCAIPYSDAAQELAEANGSEIEDIGANTGLASVDFRALLTQMGKSISVSTLQGPIDETYTPALFGQNKWVESNDTFTDSDSD